MDRIPFDMNPGKGPDRRPRHRSDRRPLGLYIVGALILILLVFGNRLVNLWVDARWYSEVGYSNVFWTLFRTRWVLGLAFFALFLLVSLPNVWLALRFSPPAAIPMDLRGQMGVIARRSLGPLLHAIAVVVAFLGGLAASSQWSSWLLFRHAVPFGVADPLFHHDVGFYVFRLPFLSFTLGFLTAALVLTLVGVVFAYSVVLAQYYDPVNGWLVAGRRIPASVARHVSVLVALILLLKAVGYWFDRYGLLYGSSAAVSGGAGYADVHGRLPVLYLLMVLTVVAALVWIVQLAVRRVTWGIGAIVALVAVSFLGGVVYPGILEQVRVKPNELTAEEPFIRDNIEFTRRAYALDGVAQTDFVVRNDFSSGLIRRNTETLNNARLWDYTIAGQAYRQLQEIKPYYQFPSVDVDRYTVNGRYRQLLISAREMNQSMLPDQAQSFQNIHLVYTHGIGFVLSPVNEVSTDGQPVFLVRGIPPTTSTDLKIAQTRLYFGELDQPWAVVDSSAAEFDYPGQQDVYTRYQGKAGLRVGGTLSRLALAYYLGDQNFLLSRFISSSSRLIIRRQIKDRIGRVAPFLRLDGDAYPVLADGRLVWMQDAYTVTDRYPYSESFEGDFNYIRNSVKAVVDAYDGTVSLYATDGKDPILQAYSRAFPSAFRPMSKMPASLRAHIRYPEDLFEVQSNKYLVYHMTDPKTFFTKEDAWDLPRSARGEVGATGGDTMEAYYIIMRLPGSKAQEMVMIRPFTPKSKNNMIAWMAARCDPANYGQIVVYRFPLDNLPLGPSQVDASVLQKPEISKELTLLNQQGSQVVLGNMLTIPLEHSLLYVQPLYVQTSNQGNSRAELTRVIVAYADRVLMGNSLSDALDGLFGGGVSGALAPGGTDQTAQAGPSAGAAGTAGTAGAARPSGARRDLVDRAVSAYDRAQAAQRKGDWAGYGAALKDLETSLRQLQQESR